MSKIDLDYTTLDFMLSPEMSFKIQISLLQ